MNRFQTKPEQPSIIQTTTTHRHSHTHIVANPKQHHTHVLTPSLSHHAELVNCAHRPDENDELQNYAEECEKFETTNFSRFTLAGTEMMKKKKIY
jgi:hypothetical protein